MIGKEQERYHAEAKMNREREGKIRIDKGSKGDTLKVCFGDTLQFKIANGTRLKGVGAMFRRKDVFKKVTSLVICELLILWQMDMALWARPAYAANEQFTQTDWYDGASAETIVHPTNRTGWNKYASKDDTTYTGAPGKITLTTATRQLIDDTDTDFTGTSTGLDLIGTGAAATLQVKAETGDPFDANLGVWRNYPHFPSLGYNSTYTRGGDYIYALWTGWSARTVFGRWDITNKKWDFMADFPASVGSSIHVGTSLCYPGSGDFIYGLRGGATKDFYKYSISADAWTKIKDTPQYVLYGAGLAAKDSGTIYAVFGGYTPYFYKYVVASNAWVQQTNTPWGDHSYGGNIVYPGTGDYIYANRGQNDTRWARYSITANNWTDLTATPYGMNWDAIMNYPGSGNHIYFRNTSGGNEFFRYDITTSTWQKSPTDLPYFLMPYYWSRGYFYWTTDGTNPKIHYLSGMNYGDILTFDLNTLKWDGTALSSPLSLPWRGGGARTMVHDGGDYIYYVSRCFYYRDFYRYSISNKKWESLALIPEPRGRCNGSLTYLNGYVYFNTGRCCNYLFRYNPSTNTWEQLASPPERICYGAIAGVTVGGQDYIYALKGERSTTFWRYNVANNTWETLAVAPECVASGSGNSYLIYPGTGDYIYAQIRFGRLFKYSISNNTWSSLLSDGPFGTCNNSCDNRSFMVYPGSGDYIYKVAASNISFGGLQRYSMTNNTWEALPSAPFATGQYCTGTAGGGYIYVASGVQYGFFRYDVSTGQWSDSVEQNYEVYAGNGVYVPSNDTVYYFTGNRDTGTCAYVWKLDLSDRKFTGLFKAPFLMSFGTKAFYPGTGDYIYILEGKKLPYLWRFDVTTGAFTQMANAPFGVGYGGALTGDATMLYATRGDDTKTVAQYDIGGNAWAAITDTPETIPSNSYELNNLAKAGSYLYCVRAGNTTTFWRYDSGAGSWSSMAALPANFYTNACLYYPGTGDFLYAADGSYKNFYKYSISGNTWTKLGSIPRMDAGGGLFYPGTGDIIYSVPGGRRADVQRYSIAKDTWDQPLELMSPSYGAAMVGLNDGDTIYYRPGGNNSAFSKYSISARTTTGLATSPSNVDEWSARMATDGANYVYATKGRGRYDIWKYSIAANTWSSFANPPSTFGTGHDIVYKKGYIYAIRADSATFWKLDPNSNTWAAKANAPGSVSWGGRLAAGDGNYIYCVQGGGSDAFHRYNTTADTWATMAALPLTVARNGNDASALCYTGGDYIYYAPGTNWSTSEGESKIFLRYSISQNKWEELASSPGPFRSGFDIVYPGQGRYLYANMGYGDTEMYSYLLYAEGIYTSLVKDVGNNNSFGVVDWTTNGKGAIEVKVRTSANKDMSGALDWLFCQPVEKGSDLTSYGSVASGHRYLQYRVRLVSDDLTQLAALDKVTISVKAYGQRNELVSSAYNTTFGTNRLTKLQWTKTQPEGTDIRFQFRTAPTEAGLNSAQWLGPAGTQEFNNNYTTPGDYAAAPQIEVVDGVARLKKVLEEYAYSQRIMVDNSAGTSSYTNKVVTLNLTSANKDFWAHVKTDGSDVRFADSSANLLSYNLAASGANFDYANKTAKIYVKIPSIAAGEKVSIYMKYGKADAVSASDPAVAPLYADFSGTAIDADKFAYGGGAVTQNDTITLTNDNSNWDNYITSKETWTRAAGLTFYAKIKVQDTGTDTMIGWHNSGTGASYTDLTYAVYFCGNGWVYVYEDGNGRGNIWTYSGNTWYDVKIVLKATGATYFYRASGLSTWTQFYDSNYSSATPLKIGISHYTNGKWTVSDDWDVTTGEWGGGSGNLPYSFYSLQEAATSASLSGWDKRLAVRVDNTQGSRLLNYQGKVVLDASQESFWAACRSDGKDIRFVDSDNATILNYYRASFDYTNKNATLYAKIPIVAAGEEKIIYLYYGRADASDTSAMANTMTKNFNEFAKNASGIALDGLDDKAVVTSSGSLNITDNVTLEAQVRYDIDYWPEGWTYRKKVTLDNTAGGEKTSYTAKFDVPYQSEMKVDYTDLRFYETDHSKKLKYEIKSYDGTKANVWVEVPLLLANSTKDIYMYYGNPAASNETITVVQQITFNYPDYTGWTDNVGGAEPNTWDGGSGWRMMGGRNNYGSGAYTEYTIADLGAGTYTVTFDYFYSDSWDGEQGRLLANGTAVWSESRGGGTKLAGKSVDVVHTGGNLTLRFTSTLDQGAGDESFGVDNITVPSLVGATFTPIFSGPETPPAIIKWLPGFAYRQRITIDNTAGSNYNEVLAQMEIPYQAGKMNANYSDLRFVGPEGKLDYQLISYTGIKALVGVSVKQLLKAKKDIYVYYGNANAASESTLIGLNTSISFSDMNQYDYTAGPITALGTTGIQFTTSPTTACANAWNWYCNYKTTTQRASSPTLYFRFNEVTFRCYKQEGLVGWKNTSATQTVSAFPHAIYFSNTCNNGIFAIENGTVKGTKMAYSRGAWYEGKITLKPSGGATYYARAAGTSTWTLLYDSTAGTDTDLKPGADFNSCRNRDGYYSQAKDWSIAYGVPASSITYGGVTMLTAYGTPSVVVFSAEEAQPAIDQTILGKAGAYELKFTTGGLTAVVNSTSASTANYDVNKFMHAAMTYDGAKIKVYVNGAEKASADLTGAITTNANNLIIGDKIKGAVDEARVWNIARPAGGILGDRYRSLAGDEPGLKMYLRCNEGAGTAAADTTVNANNGTLQGGAGWHVRPFAYSNEKPAAQFHLDDGAGLTAADSSGNGNHLILTNPSWSSDDLTGYNGDFSVSLNGVNAYMQAADAANLDFSDAVSLEAWVKPQVTEGTQMVIDKGDDSANSRNYALYLLGNNVTFSFYNGGYKTHSTTAAALEPLGKYHLVATYDTLAQKVNIYVNGVLQYTGAETAGLSGNNKPLLLGKSVSGNYFKGIIDEARIYNRPLAANEARRHYETAQYAMSEPEPVVYFDYEPNVDPAIAVYYKKNPVVQPVIGVFYNSSNIEDFAEIVNKPAGTEIKYQCSPDGYNWYWNDGTNWADVTGGYSQANTAAEVKNKLANFQATVSTSGGAPGTGDFYYRAYMHSDEASFNTPSLDNIKITLKTGETYYVDSSGATAINTAHTDAANDQWYQYKALLYTDGALAPLVDDATVDYIKAFITVGAPNGGEFVRPAQHIDITWTSDGITGGATGKMKLEYSADGGNTYNTIATGVANTGLYDWTVPDDSTANALVKVTSEDFPTVSDASDAAFKISSMLVTSPNGGEIWEAGRQHAVRWSTSGSASNNLTIQYSTNGGTTWTNAATQRPNTGTYTWTLPSVASDNCLVKVYDANNDKITDTADAIFSIVPQPTITITAPAGGEVWNVGLSKELSWRTNQKQFNNTVDIEYSADNFATVIPIAAAVSIGTPQGADNNSIILGTYNWTVPDTPATNIKVRIKESAVPSGRDTQAQVTAVANAITIALPSISITAPTTESTWVKGDTQNITWTSQGAVSNNLTLEYSADNGTTWAQIAIGEANDGLYAWTIPVGAVSNNALVKITDASRPLVFTVSSAFKILANPKISIIQPNGGESLTIGTTYDIKWNSYGKKLLQGGADYNAINLYYSTNNGTTWTLISDQQANTGMFVWTVPDAESNQCLIKVADNNDAQIFGVSAAVFGIVLPTVTLTSPNGGETLYATGNHNITWTSTGSISSNLKLEYSTDNGTTWTTIVSGQANTMTFAWSVADAASPTVLVRITDASRPAVTDVSNAVFGIMPPSITILAPNGAEEWVVGTDNQIRWTSMGKEAGAIRDNLTIQYSTNGGTTWNAVTAQYPNTGSYVWTVPDAVSTNCQVKIFDASRTATTDTSDAAFKIVLPYVQVLTPNGGESWVIGTGQDITWRSVGAISDNIKLEYSTNNFTTATVIAIGEVNDGTYSWTVPDDYSLSAKVRITDGSRTEVTDSSDGIFTINNPVITLTRPNGAELLTVGDVEAITWENLGSVSNSLKIEYSKDNFVASVVQIAASVTNTGTYNWTIPNDVSAVVRVRVTDNNRTTVWDKSDAVFTILPTPAITVSAPNGGEIWRVGKAYDITWTDNGGRISNNLTLQYSTNAGSTWQNIATGVSNSGTYSWTIPDTVSTTCLIKIFDATRTSTVDSSDANFRIADPLITFTAPVGGEQWAVGDRANITWTTEGTASDSLVMEFSPDGGITYYFVATVANTGTYTWTVADYITSSAYIKIKDALRVATTTTSARFTIIPMPTITITSPVANSTYVLGDEVNVTWTWTGLSISNNLLIEVSTDNFVSSRQVIAIGETNDGQYTWNLTGDTLTGQTLKLRITDGNRTEIKAISEGYFRIRGGFTLTKPNGGENWGAKSPQTITWETRGNIPTVKLEYTVNDGTTWTVIAAAATNNNSYAWTLPDIQTSTCKVRVSQPDDTTVTDTGNDVFGIVYFTVRFNVLDYDTLQHMNELTINEPSTGWSDTGAISPITRTLAYPYGTYTTFFAKTNFIDNSVTWSSPKEGTSSYVVTGYLENSASAQVSWESILTYSYNPGDDTFGAVGSLQRKGKLVGTSEMERQDMGAAVVTVYEPDGATVRKSLTATAPSISGTYTFTYASTGFEVGKVYPATLSIDYRGRPYISSANIDVGAEILQYEFFTKTAANLAASVTVIEAAVAGGTSQTRADIEASRKKIVDDLENTREEIAGDISASQNKIVGDIATSQTAVKSHVSDVLATTETILKRRVAETKDLVATAMKSAILNTESAIRTGNALAIRYRTYTGLAPTIDVYDASNALVVSGGSMTEIGTTGIYEYALTFQGSWGSGDFTIVCSESTKGTLDALILTVISTDLEQIAGQVAGILGSTSTISSLKSAVDSFSSQFSMLETALSKMSRDLVSQVKEAASSVSQFDSIFSQLSNMAKQMKEMAGESSINLEKLYDVSKDKKDDMVYLKNKTQELKAAMELNIKLIDNVANKPITQTWYEYKE